jgi:hypothetical protein
MSVGSWAVEFTQQVCENTHTGTNTIVGEESLPRTE